MLGLVQQAAAAGVDIQMLLGRLSGCGGAFDGFHECATCATSS
jgi:hypothetical protein